MKKENAQGMRQNVVTKTALGQSRASPTQVSTENAAVSSQHTPARFLRCLWGTNMSGPFRPTAVDSSAQFSYPPLQPPHSFGQVCLLAQYPVYAAHDVGILVS